MEENTNLNFGGILAPVDEKTARLKNPVVLAFIGDTVYDLFVRANLVKTSSEHVHALNKKARSFVNAEAQARFSEKIEFTEDELSVFKRARNAKVGTTAKNMSVTDYHKATGLEAVIGYLYLTGQHERLEEIFERILENG